MTATTGAPGFIEYYTNSDLDPIPDGFASLATSVNESLQALVGDSRQVQSFRWASQAAQNAQTGMVSGDEGWRSDLDMGFVFMLGAWRPSSGSLPSLSSVGGVAQSIPAATLTRLTTWAAPNIRFGITYSSGLATATYTGWYSVSAGVQYPPSATAGRLYIRLNGLELVANGEGRFVSAAGNFYINAGQQIDVGGYHPTTSSVTPLHLSMMFLHA